MGVYPLYLLQLTVCQQGMFHLNELFSAYLQIAVFQISEEIEGYCHGAIGGVFDGNDAVGHGSTENSVKDVSNCDLRHERRLILGPVESGLMGVRSAWTEKSD